MLQVVSSKEEEQRPKPLVSIIYRNTLIKNITQYIVYHWILYRIVSIFFYQYTTLMGNRCFKCGRLSCNACNNFVMFWFLITQFQHMQLIIEVSLEINLLHYNIQTSPMRTWVRIHLPHPLVCCKRRLNGAVLQMRPEKTRSRVTANVARKRTLPAQRPWAPSIGLNFAALHWQWWRLHISKIFSNGM
jgi:hypothetical protein